MPLANPPLVYIPSPATYGTRQLVKTPLLRADVSGAVQLLANRPFFLGQQTNTGQSIQNLTDTQIAIDTELGDPYGGHLDAINPARYYAMVPGWYLVETAVPLNYSGGAGALSAGMSLSVAGGASTFYYGQRIPNSATAGQVSAPVCAKLVQLTHAGTYGGPGNDFVTAAANQNSGTAQSVWLSPTLNPAMRVRWIAAPSGTPGLTVPANDPWPQPPGYITSGFLNKNIRDAIRYLTYPPILEAWDNGTAQNLASATAFPLTGTTISLDSAAVDTYSAFNTSTSTYTIPPGCGGLYYCYGQVAATMDANALSLSAGLTLTSPLFNAGVRSTIWGGAQAAYTSGGFDNAAVIRRRLRLLPGDTVSLAGWQRNSAADFAAVLFSPQPSAICCRLVLIWQAA